MNTQSRLLLLQVVMVLMMMMLPLQLCPVAQCLLHSPVGICPALSIPARCCALQLGGWSAVWYHNTVAAAATQVTQMQISSSIASVYHRVVHSTYTLPTRRLCCVLLWLWLGDTHQQQLGQRNHCCCCNRC